MRPKIRTVYKIVFPNNKTMSDQPSKTESVISGMQLVIYSKETLRRKN
jgi:hypothetical protein